MSHRTRSATAIASTRRNIARRASITGINRVNQELTPPASPVPRCEQESSSPTRRTLRSQTKGCEPPQDDDRARASDKKHNIVVSERNILKAHSQRQKKDELLAASNRSAIMSEARRMALRNVQAVQDPRKTTYEPDLNDESEVRHFEVDEYGSLTFMLFETMEAWIMREIPWDDPGNEGTQAVAGRLYQIVKV